jgi:hypothetical protein
MLLLCIEAKCDVDVQEKKGGFVGIEAEVTL